MITTLREPRLSAYARGYTKKWSAASQRFLAEFYYCGMRPNNQPPVMSRCHTQGVHTPATQTDHVIPHRSDPTLFWDREHNWQALCASCGAAKSQAGL